MVQASRDEASLAARLYNDPAEVRSFEGFVVHMHLAWLYLLHAELTRDGVDFRYRRKDNPRLLIKVDGEPKRWELARCAAHRWPSADHPVRVNLEFFIGLRNKIEHRYARQQNALTAAVGGHAQALLLNYEEELTAEFGSAVSLATRLRFPVFIGSFTDQGEQALRRLRRSLPAALRTFIADYHAGLDVETQADPRFEFRLRVTNELAPKDPDALALQFTKYHELTEEQRVTWLFICAASPDRSWIVRRTPRMLGRIALAGLAIFILPVAVLGVSAATFGEVTGPVAALLGLLFSWLIVHALCVLYWAARTCLWVSTLHPFVAPLGSALLTVLVTVREVRGGDSKGVPYRSYSPGVRVGGSHAPVVKSLWRASSLSWPHLVVVSR